ncbi:putative RNA-directed DNA polymerase from transposon BS [Caerostris extrusa]|uniref:RNA-directed DNA polymerase from transposon BS n=1 Tax=Caerostris extrusa TaxID=172846 RepID=A0AAV4PKD2_CAEEX|nr:putative RNA-directed DNA polymerase from transposon BS [Caerostris extrusa]
MLFLSGIEKVISKDVKWVFFADDVVMWYSGTDLQKLEDNLNSTLEDLWKFAEKHKLIFNSTKSTVGFFTTNRKLYGYQSDIVMNHQPLTVGKHPKYLGFVLDPEITCNKHIDHIVLKGRKATLTLKVHFRMCLGC